jgi:hypothetical protein
VGARAILMLLSAAVFAAEPEVPETARAIRQMNLDPALCFRVRDFAIPRQDIKLYLNDGYLIFAQPVQGRHLLAIFSADMEGGDGEVIVLPPTKGERRTLATFAGAPNLNEHFKSAMFLFTDGLGEELLRDARARSTPAPEAGLLLADRYRQTARGLAESFELRILQDVGNRVTRDGIFFATLASPRLGNFDVVYDPLARDQITVGQAVTRENRITFDTWTSFESVDVRLGRRARPKQFARLADFVIEATLESSLSLRAVTRAMLIPEGAGLRVFPLQISERMELQSVSVDGRPASVYRRPSPRADAMRWNENSIFLVTLPEGLEPAQAHRLEIRHEGQVVTQAGPKVYYVGSRGQWYPNINSDFATFDLTFRYPKDLDLVATGEVLESRVEGEQKITRRRTSSPIRFAGFNLGEYERVSYSRNGYTIEVCANRRLDSSMQRPTVMVAPAPPMARFPNQRNPVLVPAPAVVDPLGNLKNLAANLTSAFESLAAWFGPPPLKHLTVSPIPGGFGQGFPGLVYLSTMAYLDPKDLPVYLRDRGLPVFYSELLGAHEVAHQWWGNSVTAAGYQDDWLQEALASYTSILLLEQRRGVRLVDPLLADYRNHLLEKDEQGRTLESTGPITLGLRLRTSQRPEAWRTITYEKGSWILHMLRAQLGDAAFRKFLGELARKYQRQPVTNEEFRGLAAGFLPPKSPDPKLEVFFDNWVYSTGIPRLTLTSSIRGPRVTGTLTQAGVAEDFEADVPLEITYAKSTEIRWVRSSHEAAEFAFTLRETPLKIALSSRILRQP